MLAAELRRTRTLLMDSSANWLMYVLSDAIATARTSRDRSRYEWRTFRSLV